MRPISFDQTKNTVVAIFLELMFVLFTIGFAWYKSVSQ